MGKLRLFPRRKLGHGSPQLGKEEDRVIPKALGASRQPCDLTAAVTRLGRARAVRKRKAQNALELRAALWLGDVGHLGEELLDSRRVRTRRVPRGSHPRTSTESIDAKARVIRQRRHPGGLRARERLEPGVSLERFFPLLDLRQIRKIFERFD